MAKSRMYGWNGQMPAKQPSGQKLIVLNGMKQFPDQMLSGHGWAELLGKELATRQDPYRVVLYYILILKKEGCIKTSEQEIAAVTRDGETKHAVTIKTASTVEEREMVPDNDGDNADGDDDGADADAGDSDVDLEDLVDAASDQQ